MLLLLELAKRAFRTLVPQPAPPTINPPAASVITRDSAPPLPTGEILMSEPEFHLARQQVLDGVTAANRLLQIEDPRAVANMDDISRIFGAAAHLISVSEAKFGTAAAHQWMDDILQQARQWAAGQVSILCRQVREEVRQEAEDRFQEVIAAERCRWLSHTARRENRAAEHHHVGLQAQVDVEEIRTIFAQVQQIVRNFERENASTIDDSRRTFLQQEAQLINMFMNFVNNAMAAQGHLFNHIDRFTLNIDTTIGAFISNTDKIVTDKNAANAHPGGHIVNLNRTVAESNAAIANLNQTVATTSTEVSRLQTYAQDMSGVVSSNNAENARLQATIGGLAARAEELRQAASNTNAENACFHEQLGALATTEAENFHLRARIAQLNQAASNKQSYNAQLRTRIAQLDQAASNKQSDNARLQARIEDLRNAIRDAQTKRARLKLKNDKLKRKFEIDDENLAQDKFTKRCRLSSPDKEN
ncbi:hypothetical protein EJ06DRAFT_549821 [Trichodelitschia bisporula]|uniref:Uncharacterized protein n=1 Tax=Trichodelitschia bisporula TaxID=703511 RepID=A0A6G1HTE9_9PEZI|nr:hypothetical protein EJ06DRAFT_549821 [Trichodelitschia bisporula]